MPRWNYPARKNIKKQFCECGLYVTEDPENPKRCNTCKKFLTSAVVKKIRMNKFLDVIMASSPIKRFDVQQTLRLGDGTFERIHREVVAYYDNEIKYNKKTREYSYISIIKETQLN